jgi:hypothetical protein
MDEAADTALHAYYARGEERDRLAQARGMVEFERTKQILLRRLPAPPSLVADVGGGPGRYAVWLAERGHQVEHRDLAPGSFSAFCHRPRQLGAELRAAGFRLVDLVAVEGLAFALDDLDERLADPLARAVVLETASALERVPELLGIGPHLLATGIRPAG